MVIQRADAKAREDDRAGTEQNTQTIVAALKDTKTAIAEFDKRLAQIEWKPT